MVAIKPVADIARKWADVTPGRASFYTQGVQAPRTSWATAAQGARQNYKASISAGDIEARFAGGVAKAGDAKWQRGATTKGAARFGPGVQAATQDYQSAFEPFASAIQGASLPARAPRGSPQNYQRVQTIGDILNKRRTALRAGGR